MFNLLVMAIVPAIGEELFFRGFIQNTFLESNKRLKKELLVRHIQKSQLVYQSFLTPKARESGLLKSETPINSPSSIIIDCVHVAVSIISIL